MRKGFVREEWNSNDSNNNGKKEFVKKEWDSSDRNEIRKRTAADRIRASTAAFKQKLAESRAAARAERAYKKSPEGRAATIKQLRQEYAYESAKQKLAKVKSVRRKQQMDSLGLFGMGGGMDAGFGGKNQGIGMPKQNWSGMDSMFGMGGQQSARVSRPRAARPQKSGFDELFGF